MTAAVDAPQQTIASAWRLAVRQAAIRNQHQRALVLRFPAIAKRLCEPPLRLAFPHQWTGYIPGYWESEDRHGRVRTNNSPVRAQLAQILQDAAERADAEAGQGAAPTRDAETPEQITPPWRTQ